MVERATSLHGGAIWRTYVSRAEQSRAISTLLEEALTLGLMRDGRACAALGGGTEPLPVYERLANSELDWANITIVPTDERRAPPDHVARNDRAIARAFQRGLAKDARIISLEDSAPINALPPFDAVLLGMGPDGHIASLFPHTDGLAAAMDPQGAAPLAALTPNPLPENAPFPRLTLSLARLIDARKIVLMITGEDKRKIALAATEFGDLLDPPVRGLFAAAHVEVHWSA